MHARRVSTIVALGLILAGLALLITPTTAEVPQPSVLSDSWELDFTYEKPRIITVDIPGQGPTAYWYIAYKVTNNTGRELIFVPEATIFTDAGDLIAAPRKVPPIVFDAVKAEQRNPLLDSPIDIIGPILQGPDNARQSVILWPAPTHDVDSYSVFVGGISGETAVVDPDGTIIPEKPETNEPRDIQAHAERKKSGIALRKTLVIEVVNPGDPAYRATAPVILKRDRWVMR